ncbi:hypothetical protein SteCoe_39143 [Stentor coeruleus]|uniref:CCHC-type domain-containing protein n=1 Tax=Stentor coeruleus TaxID=5963 RepID=A0A1R2AL22_9CILI|nr:hypothetical protein SteCoe_39143 [Stentor coeruleus]
MICYNCRTVGHKIKDCPLMSVTCENCNKRGHMLQNCPGHNFASNYNGGNQRHRGNSRGRGGRGGRGGNRNSKTCYNCNELGHLFKDCPLNNQKACLNCQQLGHIASDCSYKKAEECPVNNEEICPHSNNPGHTQNDCQKFMQNNNEMLKNEVNAIDLSIKCYKCQQLGHIFKNCKFKVISK